MASFEVRSVAGNMSRRSSIATIPPSFEGAHRLDLLIEEQKAAVKNTQDGLKQSLAILKQANSKEEKESARMQVQSLFSRAEELVLLLRVISEIRAELGHIQREIVAARKNKENPRLFYARQQWLEVRLEKLLLAKKRARPGARGRRNQLAPIRPVEVQRTKKKSFGTLSTLSSHTKSIQDSLDIFSDRGTSFSVRGSTAATSTTRGAAMDTSSESGTSEESGGHYKRGGRGLDRVELSTRRSQCQSEVDSDAWHSESEANWTLFEASLKQNNSTRETSQILSTEAPPLSTEALPQNTEDGKRRPSVTFDDVTTPFLPKLQKEVLSSFNEQEENKMDSKDVPIGSPPGEGVAQGGVISPMDVPNSLVHGFHPPRPIEVFGACSWNVLPLAVGSNLVALGKDDETKGSRSVIRPDLEDFSTEIEILQKLIHDVSRATVVSGPLIATTKKTALGARTRSRTTPLTSMPSTFQGQRSSLTDVGSSSSQSLLESIPSECSRLNNSRRIYGGKGQGGRVYPRPHKTWCSGKRSDPDSQTLLYSSPKVDSSLSVDFSALDLQASLRMRLKNRQISRGYSRSRSRAATAAATVDVFDRELHQNKCIEHLLHQTESSLAVVRKESVQALGMLPHISGKAKERLQAMLFSDEDDSVRYHALYSLIQIGIMNDQIISYMELILSRGCCELKVHLLQLLCQQRSLEQYLEKFEGGMSALLSVLRELLASGKGEEKDVVTSGKEGEDDVSLLSAVLLSHAHLEKDKCLKRLKSALKCSTSSRQSTALHCLLKCWHCAEKVVIDSAIVQMSTLYDWKLRMEAVKSLHVVSDVLMDYRGGTEHESEGIFQILTRRLVNEPILAVRVAIGKLLKALKLDSKAENSFLIDLESHNEITRSNAVLGLSAFELRGKRTVQILQDCVELDPSMYVRIQVVRMFGALGHYNPKIAQYLLKKCKGEDIVAKECLQALQNINKALMNR